MSAQRGRLVDRAFLAVFAATLAAFVSIAMLLPVLPRFAEGPLGAGPVGIGLAVGAASITALLFQPLAGRLSDVRGRRLLLVGGTAVSALSIAAYALTESVPVLVAARLVTGVGEAMWFVGAATTVNDLAPPARRGEAFSYFTLAAYGGLAVGPLLGDVILGGDRFGTVFLAAAASAGVACAIATRVAETRAPDAAPPTGRLVYRGAVAPGLVLLSGLVSFGGFNAFVALYAVEVGFEPVGLVFAIFAVVVISVRLFGARLPDVLGPRRAGFLALIAIAGGMATVAAWHAPAGLVVGTIVFSTGQALAFPAMMAMTVAGAPDNERGAAVGTISAFVDLSLITGAVALGAVAEATGYRGAFATAALVAVAGMALLSRLSTTTATLNARIGNSVDSVR